MTSGTKIPLARPYICHTISRHHDGAVGGVAPNCAKGRFASAATRNLQSRFERKCDDSSAYWISVH